MANPLIRNFSIIAHIDHGKSTLADRILEKTCAVAARDMEAQLLDNMDIERERGITIKARAVSLNYTAKDGKTYLFNLIDTPGHVDFNYEVSRSLAACEGAVLIIDASQGIEAQTLANTYLAVEADLELVPVINKIDLASAEPERVAQEVESVIGIPCLDAPRVSAKLGTNIEEVLERIVTDIPAPTGDEHAPLQALIFDSFYDPYKGVIIYVRVKEGTVRTGDQIRLMATGATFTVVEAGVMSAVEHINKGVLQAGEVGYLTASIKSIGDTRVGDTVTLVANPAAEPLPGYRKVSPMVFSGTKTVTTRTSVKVQAGGTFWLSDMGTERRFVVSEVHEGTVSEIVDGFWRREGYADPTAFAMDLARIYPELRSDTVVYAHVFREVSA